MSYFSYTAKTSTGQEVTGRIQADSETAAVRALSDRQLFPVRVASQEDQGAVGWPRRVSLRQLGVMYGQLADLMRTGVPLLPALDVVQKVNRQKALGDVLAQIRSEVAGGKALADAMLERPEVFNDLHVAMVRAGERGGFLEDVLTNLSVFIERIDELRSKVIGSLIYPALLMGAGLIIMSVILLVLVPQFTVLFESNANLPLPTQVVFGLSDLLRNYWLPITALGMVLALVVFWGVRGEAGRRAWDHWRMRIPLLGNVILIMCVTRLCRILGTMLGNGVPILQALPISKDAAGSMLLADTISSAAESVRSGEGLALPLKNSGIFPADIVEMIAVAEQSNQLEKVLLQIAETFERRVNRQVDQLVRLIEPLILMVLAGGIGFVAVGLLWPIFTMAQAME